MEFVYHRSYVGPLKGVLLDWAGTTVDYGCFAPVQVFVEVFQQRDMTVTTEQARLPMGLGKKDHIRAIAAMEPVARQWEQAYARPVTEEDIEAMFQEFNRLQPQTLLQYADLIPGLLGAIDAFRTRGLKIGSTTGYSRQLMDMLLPAVAQRGYSPDSCVCPTDVPAGRPAPWMAFQNAIRLQCYPMSAFVKMGDTVPDIEEGLNAGMWTIGLTKSGNGLGLTREEADSLAPDVLAARLGAIEKSLRRAGAHYVVETIADTPPLLDEIAARLQQGERP